MAVVSTFKSFLGYVSKRSASKMSKAVHCLYSLDHLRALAYGL
nr:MAG TPA: hypothetical protein [Caudoviricetes sp.]